MLQCGWEELFANEGVALIFRDFLTAHHVFYMEARGLHVPDLMPLHQEKTHALCTPPSVVGYPLRTQSCILVSSDRILHLGYLSPTGA